MSSETEKQYYNVRREIGYRVRDIFLAIEKARLAIPNNPGEAFDQLGNLQHQAEMIEFAFQEAEKKIEDDLMANLHDAQTRDIQVKEAS